MGDYILSNKICIERKGVNTSDLYSSIKGGRLKEQIVKMSNYYENVALLIEFDGNFDISTKFKGGLFSDKRDQKEFLGLPFLVNKTDTNFIYLWSFSPTMTGKLFLEIKKDTSNEYFCTDKAKKINKRQNSEKRKKVKVDKTNQNIMKYLGQEDKAEQENNARDKINKEKFIRSVKGINIRNYDLVSKNFKSILDFLTADESKLTSVFGESTAKDILENLTLSLFDDSADDEI